MLASLLLALHLAAGPQLLIAADRGTGDLARGALALRQGEPARLLAVLRWPDGRCLAPHAGLRLGGRPCGALDAAVAASARWTLARPRALDYDTTRACPPPPAAPGCHAPIQYDAVELTGLQGALEADVPATVALAAPGSRRLALQLTWQGETLATPHPTGGPEDDALVPHLFELVVRRDDTYVGRLTELLGAPFVLAPARLPGLGHQADLRLGADCVALVISGRRRLGEPWGYVAPGVLRRWLTPVGAAAALVGADGDVADLGPVREGDVLHFGFQTAVLSRDNTPVGRLDAGDLVIHTFHGLAEEVPLGALPYRDAAVEVLRWPEP